MTPVEINESLMEYQAFFKREISRNVSIGELTHLIGRIGELYVANKTNGTMAIYTNQKGYDVLSSTGKKISVKTTATVKGSHQFFFNENTIDLVDEVYILRIDLNGNIEELFYDTVENAKKLMVPRGKLAISQSKLSNLSKYLKDKIDMRKEVLANDVSMLSMDYYDFKIENVKFRLFVNGNVIRIEEDGKLVKRVKPKLRDICKKLGIKLKYTDTGKDSTTNYSYTKNILKKLETNNSELFF